jgi:hypothetical protein
MAETEPARYSDNLLISYNFNIGILTTRARRIAVRATSPDLQAELIQIAENLERDNSTLTIRTEACGPTEYSQASRNPKTFS